MYKRNYTDELPRVAAWERVTEYPLTVLAFAFLAAYAYPILNPEVGESTKALLVAVDVFVYLAFAVDYFGRLVIAANKWLFVKRNVPDLLLVLLPPARPLRLLRVTTLLIEAMWRHIKHRTRAKMAVFATGTAALLIFLASLALLDAERGHPDAQVQNFGDALWWAAVSVTTVGYGDLVPVTTEGRIVALSLMFVGIGLIGFITGSMTSWVIDKINETARARTEEAGEADEDTVLTSVHTLRHELVAIRRELEEMRAVVGAAVSPGGGADPKTPSAAADGA
ncbi:MAG: potassium channel family protein [Stackebrandtia sp.]